MLQIKDHKGSLAGLKIKTTKGVVGYWKSQWNKGVWLSDGVTDRIYPQFVENLQECLKWEITEDEINCHKLTDIKHLKNKTK